MSVTVRWEIPSSLGLQTGTSYTVNIYKSILGEDGEYSIIASPSLTIATTSYADASGLAEYFYYVKYVVSGTESDIVIAWVEETVKETRLLGEIRRTLPQDISIFSSSGLTNRDIKVSLNNALQAVNMISPITSYSISTMPLYYEPVVKLGALIFVYFSTYLQIAIKDFTYGEGGISLNVDRGSKINTAIQNVLKVYNDMLKWVKMNDYPDAIGLGSYAIAIPQGRVLSMLYQITNNR